jgi:serine/threonine-protein kinase
MTTQPPSPVEREERLDSIVTAYFQAVDAGKAPDDEELIARHPDLAEELRRFFRGHKRIDHLAEPMRPVTRAARVDALNTEIVERTPSEATGPDSAREIRSFGAYEILETIGEGGMGVIYKARHRTLQRFVALKVLLAGQFATPTDLQRFRNETEMVASLDHPNIVPIYEVGEHEKRPFFSMKLVEGGSLNSHPHRFTADPRSAARIVVAVAGAVHHAHQRGILHRDLKPSNILLDAEGQPQVTDFGLAKRVERDDSLTRSGTIVGTPRYMAPEQTDGKRIAATTAADVYGLGAILYYLLTGRPPFFGEDILDTLEQVRHSEPIPPCRLNPAVPRDLETICLKCLQKQPSQRYSSAEQLAEDFSRFLAGKPVLARPAGRVERLVKWARRRPAAAALILVSLAGAILVAGLVVRDEWRVREALQQAQYNAEDAERQKEQASANYRQARETLRSILARANDARRGDLPKLRELRREQQEDALAFFLRIAQQQEQTPEVRFDVAEALQEAGLIQSQLQRGTDARKNLTAALEQSTALAAEFPGEPRYRALQANCLLEELRFGFTDQALTYCQQALTLWTELGHEDPTSAEYQMGLAQAENAIGSIYWSRLQRKEAMPHFLRALSQYETLTREHPGVRRYQLSVAQSQVDLSNNCMQQAASEKDATRFHDLAEANLERLIQSDPNDVESIISLVFLRANWANYSTFHGKAAAALADLEKNLRALEALQKQEPNLTALRNGLFLTHGVRAMALLNLERHKDAVAAFEQVVALSPPGAQLNDRINLVVTRCMVGDFDRAGPEAEAIARDLPDRSSWDKFYRCAQALSSVFGNISTKKTLPPAERDARLDRYGNLALSLLAKARAAAPEEWIKKMTQKKLSDDFGPLWWNDRFRDRLKQLAAPPAK